MTAARGGRADLGDGGGFSCIIQRNDAAGDAMIDNVSILFSTLMVMYIVWRAAEAGPGAALVSKPARSMNRDSRGKRPRARREAEGRRRRQAARACRAAHERSRTGASRTDT